MTWCGIGFAAVVVVVALGQSEGARRKAENSAANKTEQVKVTAAATASDLPSSQARFLATIDNYATQFRTAKNELQESSLRMGRGDAIVKMTGPALNVENWIGRITKLGTDGQDKAYIRVSIAPNIELVTFNMSALDMQGTMIPPGSKLYSNLMGMAEGDEIRVSGTFIPDAQTGFQEASITINGAMTEPAFLFYFSHLEKY